MGGGCFIVAIRCSAGLCGTGTPCNSRQGPSHDATNPTPLERTDAAPHAARPHRPARATRGRDDRAAAGPGHARRYQRHVAVALGPGGQAGAAAAGAAQGAALARPGCQGHHRDIGAVLAQQGRRITQT